MLRKIALAVNFFFAFLLLIIYVSVRISPDIFWPSAFPGLVYPMVIIVNVFFVLLWIVKMRLYFLISLTVIFAGYPHLKSFYSIGKTGQALPDTGTNINLLSYNVRVFGLYDYGPGWQLNFEHRNGIFRFLDENEFDIICLQEFVHDKTGEFKTLDTLPRFIKARHIHTGFTQKSRELNYFGLATFSRFPIVNRGEIRFPTRDGNLCIYTDIRIDGDTIRVYNVHFESIGLSPEVYLFMENIINGEKALNRIAIQQGTLQIMQRIKSASQKRALQVEMVAQSVAESPHPVVLAGDFNDTPVSFTYRVMTRYLNDAFKSGRGVGQTYVGVLPGFRIDYILHSDEFTPYNFITGDQKYSDHYPVSVTLNFLPESTN